MPPRFAYWTILVDGQPTAFRAAELDDLRPTFNRLKEKHPSAVFMWFQDGKLWSSRLEAREAATRRRIDEQRARRGEPPRDRKWRPGGTHRDPRQKYKDAKKAKWTRFKERVRESIDRRRGPRDEGGQGRYEADKPRDPRTKATPDRPPHPRRSSGSRSGRAPQHRPGSPPGDRRRDGKKRGR